MPESKVELKGAGIVLSELLETVMKVKEEAAMFKSTMDNFQLTLISLTPVISDVERLNDELGRPREEIEPLIRKMEDATDLVLECSNIQWFNCLSRCRYRAKLKGFQDWFLNHLTLLELAQWSRYRVKTAMDKNLNQGKDLQRDVDTVSEYVLAARDLYIAWGDTARYWKWTSVTHPSFPEVAELLSVCWLEIRGWIKTSSLHSNQWYEAYFVFSKGSEGTFGFKNQEVEVSLKVGEDAGQRHKRYLESETPWGRIYDSELTSPLMSDMFAVERGSDGLLEVKLGEFFTRGGEDKQVEMGVQEIKDLCWKGGIIVHGIEIRPR